MKPNLLRQILASFFFVSMLSPLVLIGQARLVIGNAYIRLNGTSTNPNYLVVGNSNTNAIARTGNGSIISEGEYNRLLWKIDDQTGNYLIPLGTISSYIPMTYQITAAGSSPGALLVATYPSASDNTPYPTGVTNTSADIGNGTYEGRSATTADRYWVMQSTGWTSKPTSSLTFYYNDNDIASPNNINELDLGAQFWDESSWAPYWASGLGYVPPLGSCDAASNKVSEVDAGSNGSIYTWVLSSKTSPLPVSLINLTARWTDIRYREAQIMWVTTSEINNSHFVVEQSTDAVHFVPVREVTGNGNTNQINTYTLIDPSCETMADIQNFYYRLKQVDFDGHFTYSKTVSLSRINDASEFSKFKVWIYPTKTSSYTLQPTLYIQSNIILSMHMVVYDAIGRTIFSNTIGVQTGLNEINLNAWSLRPGKYLVSLTNDRYKATQSFLIY